MFAIHGIFEAIFRPGVVIIRPNRTTITPHYALPGLKIALKSPRSGKRQQTLGGACDWQVPAEIGILDVELTDVGRADPIFAGLAKRQKCLQWHSVCVSQAPEGAEILARSDICNIQAMRVGEQAWSMQYHVELEPDTVANWGEIPAYAQALQKSLGPDGLATMKSQSDAHMSDFVSSAEKLYRNFMDTISQPNAL